MDVPRCFRVASGALAYLWPRLRGNTWRLHESNLRVFGSLCREHMRAASTSGSTNYPLPGFRRGAVARLLTQVYGPSCRNPLDKRKAADQASRMGPRTTILTAGDDLPAIFQLYKRILP